MGSPHYYIETYKNGVLIRKEGIKCRYEAVKIFCQRYHNIDQFAPGHDLEQAEDVLVVMCSKATSRGYRTIHAAISYHNNGENAAETSIYTVTNPVFFNCDPTYEELSKLIHDPNITRDEFCTPIVDELCFMFAMISAGLFNYQVMQDLKSCKYRNEVRMITCTLKSNYS